jgi:hypothetical protein
VTWLAFCALIATGGSFAVALTAEPADAQRAARLTVSFPSTAVAGTPMSITVRYRGARRGVRLIAQVRAGRRWRTVAARKVPRSGRTVLLPLNSPQTATTVVMRAAAVRGKRVLRRSRQYRVEVVPRQVEPPPEAPSAGSQPPPGPKSVLNGGDRMDPGKELRSPNDHYRLVMQTDGNLVLYVAQRALWASQTDKNPGAYGVMQTDGNFVIYTSDGKGVLFDTKTSTYPGARLALQNDANIVVYTTANEAPWDSKSVNSELRSGETLLPGQYLQSPDRSHQMIMQADGNFVLYAPSKPLWSSGTDGRGPGRVVMQTDGNLILYPDGQEQAAWSSGTHGHQGARLVVQGDAKAVVYDAGGQPRWTSAPDAPADVGNSLDMPFPCGEVWRAATYPNHPSGYSDPSPNRDRPIDMNHDNGDGWERGRPVVASAAGTVTRSNVSSGGSNWIEIDHGGGWKTQYLHLDRRTATEGHQVNRGQQIGTVGDTGAKGAVHLHYGQVLNGVLQPVRFRGQAVAYTHTYNGNPYKSQNC